MENLLVALKQNYSFPGLGWLGHGFTDGIIALLAGATQK